MKHLPKGLGYVLAILLTFIKIILVIVVIYNLNSFFETLVFSILVLIYYTLENLNTSQQKSVMDSTLFLYEETHEIKTILDKEKYEDEDVMDREVIKDAKEVLRVHTGIYNLGFAIVIVILIFACLSSLQ